MPTTVSLTPQQQATIDAANAALASAKSALDSATTAAQNRLADLNRCHCGKGKSLGGVCTPLRTPVRFPNAAVIDDCVIPPNINNCRTDCCAKGTCRDRVNAYNTSLQSYNSANANYATAKDNLAAILDAIAKDPTVAANQSIIETEIEGEKGKERIKWLFFGIAAVIIVGSAIFIGIKMLGRSDA